MKPVRNLYCLLLVYSCVFLPVNIKSWSNLFGAMCNNLSCVNCLVGSLSTILLFMQLVNIQFESCREFIGEEPSLDGSEPHRSEWSGWIGCNGAWPACHLNSNYIETCRTGNVSYFQWHREYLPRRIVFIGVSPESLRFLSTEYFSPEFITSFEIKIRLFRSFKEHFWT